MNGPTSLYEQTQPTTKETSRGTDPPRQVLGRIRTTKISRHALPNGEQTSAPPASPTLAAAKRQNAQLPAFAPLLEELEVAGWSSHRRALSGNFHDWSLLEGRRLLAMVGQAVAAQPHGAIDPVEAALVAQGAWASIRSHSQHAVDAGTLLSLASHSLWSNLGAELQSAVAVAVIDLDGGHASIAMAGDCLALRIRASGAEPVAARQPLLGAIGDFSYLAHSVQLSLRERILMIADEPSRRSAKLPSKVTARFAKLSAEEHRRMMAVDAIDIARQEYEQADNENLRPTVSMVAVRRR